VLFRAIQEAYKGVLMTSNYPFFILHLELDPSVIDFNVHPKKLNVRFEREEQIYNKVYNVIRSLVEENFIEKEASFISTELHDFIDKEERSFSEIQKGYREKKERPIKEIREKKKESPKIEDAQVETPVQLHLTDHTTGAKIGQKQLPETYIREKYLKIKNFPKIRLISSTGQLSNKVYIVLEGINENNEPGLYILDQHAASERLTKEHFERALETAKIGQQQLISPLKIDVTPSERFFLEENLGEIKKLGFEFDKFGGNTFILRQIPTIFGNVPSTSVIKDIIADITSIGKDKTFSEVKEDIVNYLACHKSIRGGDDLSLIDIRNLIENLSRARDPFHCAHGRPTLRFISFKELDKLFKRIP
jgi:DNA mismatch repair protein MutL